MQRGSCKQESASQISNIFYVSLGRNARVLIKKKAICEGRLMVFVHSFLTSSVSPAFFHLSLRHFPPWYIIISQPIKSI